MIVTEKVVYIHSPRTGGNSFEAALDNLAIDYLKFERHTGARFIRKYIRDQKYYFTVREPFEQLISRWEYAKHTRLVQEKQFERYTAHRHWLVQLWNDDIEEFLKNYLKNQVPHISREFNVIADYDYVELIDYNDMGTRLNEIMKEEHGIENFTSFMPANKNSCKFITDEQRLLLEPYREVINKMEYYIIYRLQESLLK